MGMDSGCSFSRNTAPLILLFFSRFVSRYIRAIEKGALCTRDLSGALVRCFPAFGADTFFGFLVVLGCLWTARVWSGRPGPGIAFCNFLGRPFCVQNVHMDSAQKHKNEWFWSYLCARTVRRYRCNCPPCSESRCFLEVLASSGGCFLIQMGLLMRIWRFHSVSVAFGRALFSDLFILGFLRDASLSGP